MNRGHDFVESLEAWLRQEAPSQAPDRLLDAALERVATESQRRSFAQRLLGGTQLAPLARAAALTAVIAVGVLVGLQFAGVFRNVGPSPSPSDVTTPSESAAPSPTAATELPAGCVNPPRDITTLIDQRGNPAADPVACYGDAPLTFDATWYGGGVADCPSAPEPAWLACSSFSLQQAGDTRKVGAPQLSVAVEPSMGVSLTGPYAQVRVTGHFDDPAAQTCVESQPIPGESARPTVDVIDRCRSIFVVTHVELLQ